MFGIVDLLTFLLGTTLIVLLPGPNTLYIMAVSAHDGIAAGFKERPEFSAVIWY